MAGVRGIQVREVEVEEEEEGRGIANYRSTTGVRMEGEGKNGSRVICVHVTL